MDALSIRELNANISGVIDRVEAGEVIDISRHGRVVAEIRPKRPVRDAAWWKAKAEMEEALRSAPLGQTGRISESDRYGNASL